MTEKTAEKLKSVGIRLPEIILPAEGTDLTKYATVACDQYSAQPEYWEDVKNTVSDCVSTLNMMMPEAWLGKPEMAAHQENIPARMTEYLASGALKTVGEGMVFVKRMTSTGERLGLVLALDLEQYDYRPGSKSLIRATEKTVEERLPVRIAIRKLTPLEMPHIMVLISDKENRLMNMLSEKTADMDCLYDFDLMKESGHLKGYFLEGEEILSDVADEFIKLRDEAIDGMLFAMGDGNHSLAAAKALWESVKEGLTEEERLDNPARFALVEIVNLYDEALAFEPIHRLLMNVDAEAVQREVGFDAKNPMNLQDLQPKLDEWLKAHPEAELEYIHGEETCVELGKKPGNLAVCWKEFPKESLFTDVAAHGCLVRKSFSMGEARDKRFYMETRRIR